MACSIKWALSYDQTNWSKVEHRVVSEFDIITQYFSSLGAGDFVALSVGDDAAALIVPTGSELIISTDTAVCGTHFDEDLFPEDVAYKAVASAVSDLAAMGAEPLGMTLALTLPDNDPLWLQGLSQGLTRASSRYAIPLVGGDTTRGPLALTVTVMGHCPCGEKILRSGAAIGDLIYVSGTLGDAAFGLSLLAGEHRGLDLNFEDQDHLVSRFTAPDAHLDLGVRLRGEASSCIDVSDGLLQDAAHIANASGCKFIIESGLVPLSPALQRAVGEPRARDLALRGGEDYQLLFTLPPSANPPSGCIRIGRVEGGEGVECDVMPKERGYDHFH